jgi:hypothetical protein
MGSTRDVESRATVTRREQAISAAFERANDQPQVDGTVVHDQIVAPPCGV